MGVECLEGLDTVTDDDLDVGLDEEEVNVDLDDVVKVGRPVGVAGLDPGPPGEEGLRIPELVILTPGDGADGAGCLDAKLILAAGSGCAFASCNDIKQII